MYNVQMLSREIYLKLVNDHIKNKNLVKHCLCVEAAMRVLSKEFSGDEEVWARVGLVHDADWEETQEDITTHTKKTEEWLKELGETENQIIEAVLAHNYMSTGYRAPQDPLEWSLYTCDELTGLIVAATLVRPDKKLENVEVASVLKKFPQKSFAAGVDREQIKMCEEKLGIKLERFVEIVLSGMKTISSDLCL